MECAVCGQSVVAQRKTQKTCLDETCQVEYHRQQARQRKKLKAQESRLLFPTIKRTCLKCGQRFPIKYPHNWICGDCRAINDYILKSHTYEAILADIPA